jgi:plastocyanin
MRIRKILVAPLAAAALVVALVVAIPAQGAGGVTVKDNFFSPKSVSVKHGGKVTWTWAGRAPHNVTFRTTHSKTQTKGSFSLTFRNKGAFSYKCTIHPGMVGTIKVT